MEPVKQHLKPVLFVATMLVCMFHPPLALALTIPESTADARLHGATAVTGGAAHPGP